MKKVHYSFIELQPDLQTPGTPIPLGVVVCWSGRHGDEHAFLGRVPRHAAVRPPGLERLSPLTYELVRKWDDVVKQVIAESPPGELFQRLASRLRWNVYATDVQDDVFDKNLSLFTVAERIFDRRLNPRRKGSPKARTRRAARRTAVPVLPTGVPDAWILVNTSRGLESLACGGR